MSNSNRRPAVEPMSASLPRRHCARGADAARDPDRHRVDGASSPGSSSRCSAVRCRLANYARSARQLAAGLRLARSEALAERRETFLVVDVAGKRFKVDRDPAEHNLSSQIDIKLFTAQNDLVSDSVGSIRFFPDGGSNGGRITVASGERKFDVDVDWLTGRVAILD